MLRRRAERVADGVIAAAPGEVLAVFAGGSVARDEVWSAVIGGRLEVYSDVDLYIVVSGARSLGPVRAAAERVVVGLEAGEHGAVFAGGVDAGVYTRDDLVAEPLRPGTADLARGALWLRGDPAAVAWPGGGADRPMHAGESLYLLENRSWNVAGERGAQDALEMRRRRVACTKAVLDIACAHLVACGRFAPRLAERMDAIAGGRPATLSPGAAREIETAYACYRDLSACLASAEGAENVAAHLVAEAWCALAPVVLDCGAQDPAALIEARCARGRRVDHAIETARLSRARGFSRPRAALTGAVLGSRSPRTAVRVHALAVQLARESEETAAALSPYFDYASRLLFALGLRSGTVGERARQAYALIS